MVRSPSAGAAPPAGSCRAARSNCTRPQAPRAYCSSGTIRLTCSTVPPKERASSQIAVSRAPSTRSVANAQTPATTTAAIPAQTTMDAAAVTWADIRHTRRPRDSTWLARWAYSRSTYGRARLVRTSSCPWMASSITAARSDHASSSPIRAGPMRRAGRFSPAASASASTSMPTAAGHQTNSAVTIDSAATASDLAIRTPGPRISEATW